MQMKYQSKKEERSRSSNVGSLKPALIYNILERTKVKDYMFVCFCIHVLSWVRLKASILLNWILNFND